MKNKQLGEQLRRPSGEAGKKVGMQMNISNELLNLWTIEQLNILDNQQVLEIGMGNGYFCNHVLTRAAGLKYYGCDLSEVMVEEAIRLNQANVDNSSASFYLAGADKLPFPDSTFDIVFSVNTIYFWEQPSQELSEIKRVLKRNGELTIAIRTKDSLTHHPFAQYGYRQYNADELNALLEENGFTSVFSLTREEPEKVFDGVNVKVKDLIMTFRPSQKTV
ncbi:methyltransferase family protein [Chitinophaga japonensis]|uniref:Methyltransferase family protein n=2 Tax=Chitinophaga japonensis TaxID=104662 RepID=A0A562SNA0_CHIJA|nr:methyltransferase family protein [Chitinophaga japonensis]